MGKVPPLPNSTIAFNKEDIFYVLLRLYRMMNDADPFNNFTDDDEESFVFDEEQNEEGGGVDETEVPPPTYFQRFYAAQDEFVVAVVNDYISLFALLSSPLDADPVLKKEFIAYAHEHGEDIEFTNDTLPPAPKLFIVPPQKDDPDGKGKKPPKK
jgi:hypothetical protein